MTRAILIIKNLVDDTVITFYYDGTQITARVFGFKSLTFSSTDPYTIFLNVLPYIHETAFYEYLDFYRGE